MKTGKLRDIFLKSIPYLLSIAGGIILFVVTVDNVKNPNVADLINNIASSLLAIPVVFLLYDYSNYRISRQLKKSLANGMNTRVSSLLLDIIILVRAMLGMHDKLTLKSVNRMQNLRQSQIASRLNITTTQTQELRNLHDALEDLIYKYGKDNIMGAAGVNNLSGLSLDLIRLLNEHKFRRNPRGAAKYLVDIIGRISDWLDSDASVAMNFDQLVQSAVDKE